MRKTTLLSAVLLITACAAYGYEAAPLALNRYVDASLSANDIPTTNGGRFKDYNVNLQAGEFVLITVTSEDFDPDVTLLDADGMQIAYNDDDEESLNSLLVARVRDSGKHTVRVGSVGSGLGQFTIRVDTLRRD